jgi:protein gp37
MDRRYWPRTDGPKRNYCILYVNTAYVQARRILVTARGSVHCGEGMAKDSSIEWTHHTFNPWWGCVKVSPGCKNCYAETFAHRIGQDIWGARASRRFFGDAHWLEPVKWNSEAVSQGVRRRVFCASMADVFENRAELNKVRHRLWRLIAETPALDWLLLTKRPERVATTVPWGNLWPGNVWIGATAENQKWAEKRIPALLGLSATVRFLSCEPLLGPLDISRWLTGVRHLDWVIAGGESGHKARPMNPAWARSLRDQCRSADVPFHFKQWGHWRPDYINAGSSRRRITVPDPHGHPMTLVRLGKHLSGRDLDGRTWDEFPVRHHDTRTGFSRS